VRFLEKTGIGVLLRGHGGELAKAPSPAASHRRARQRHAFARRAGALPERREQTTSHPTCPLRRSSRPMRHRSLAMARAPRFAEVLKGTNLSPADACGYLYLRELTRRFTVPSLELFRTRVDVAAAIPGHRLPEGASRRSASVARRHHHPSAPGRGRGSEAPEHSKFEYGCTRERMAPRRTVHREVQHPLEAPRRHGLSALSQLRQLDAEHCSWEASRVNCSRRTHASRRSWPKPVLERLLRESRDGVADRNYAAGSPDNRAPGSARNQVEGVA
jgi:hypothetical protein